MNSMWDADNLYFAFHVADDAVVVNHQGQEIWRSDHVELWIDSDLARDFTESVHSAD